MAGVTLENWGPFQTFKETAGAFDESAGLLYTAVQQDVSVVNGIEPYDQGQEPLGINYGKLSDSDDDVTVRLFGQGGTFKIKAGGVIAQDALVALNATGEAIAWTNEPQSIGVKRSAGNSADGDIIEVFDRFQDGLPTA